MNQVAMRSQSLLLLLMLALGISGLQVASSSRSPATRTIIPKSTSQNDTEVKLRTSEDNRSRQYTEQAKKGGQQEWFSMEATGLGDLEEADAIRKMMRRSYDEELVKLKLIQSDGRVKPDRYRLVVLTPGGATVGSIGQEAGMRISRPSFGLDKRETQTLRALKRSLRVRLAQDKQRDGTKKEIREVEMGQNSLQSPISISRRTAEELNDSDESDGSNTVDQDDGNLGEFDSRLSLLTMRKIQPEPNQLEDDEYLSNGNGRQSGLLVVPQGGARVRDRSRDKPRTGFREGGGGSGWPRVGMDSHQWVTFEPAPSGDRQPSLQDSSYNYLPRVARATFI